MAIIVISTVQRATPHSRFASRHPHNPMFHAPTSNTSSNIPLSTQASTCITKLRIWNNFNGCLPIRMQNYESHRPIIIISSTRTLHDLYHIKFEYNAHQRNKAAKTYLTTYPQLLENKQPNTAHQNGRPKTCTTYKALITPFTGSPEFCRSPSNGLFNR